MKNSGLLVVEFGGADALKPCPEQKQFLLPALRLWSQLP